MLRFLRITNHHSKDDHGVPQDHRDSSVSPQSLAPVLHVRMHPGRHPNVNKLARTQGASFDAQFWRAFEVLGVAPAVRPVCRTLPRIESPLQLNATVPWSP